MNSISSLIEKRSTFLFLPLLILLSLLLGSSVAHAAETTTTPEESLAMTPAIQRLAVKAGEVVDGSMTVINDGKVAYKFIVYARPYSVKNEQYDPQFETTLDNTDIYQWVQFEKVSYTLQPGERIEVPYRMKAPVNAAPGGHYGVIFAETQPDASSATSVLRKKRVGGLLLANVEGKVIRSGALVSTDAPFWQSAPPLTITDRVKNTGNTDFQATVSTSVEDMFGSVKHTETKNYTIYPGTIRKIPISWESSPWFGLFKYKQSVSVVGNTTNTSHYILLAPKWLVLLLIVALVIGAGYGLLRYKRR
jgi:hypothetical protein